ncbi:MAG: hypothetical protein AB7T03_01200 [Bacilli bacterium]
MIKDAIGLLDMGMESFPLLPFLSKTFKHERFIYINDLLNQPYEGKTKELIIGFVQKNVARLQKEPLKLLIVGSDIIWEYAQDFLKTLTIPVINIVDLLIEHINLNYEQKNMVLLAKNSVLEANLYQKNIKYNRLYSIPSDELEAIVLNKKTKTTKSFYTAKETLLPALKKEVDIIITSTPLLMLVKTEIEEYLRLAETTNLLTILEDKIKASEVNFNLKGRGRIDVLGYVSKKQFANYFIGQPFSFKYFDLTKESEKTK